MPVSTPICRLFCPALSSGPLTLSVGQSQHAIVSLRASPGQCVVLFDGAGHEASARIERIDRKRLCVDVGPIEHRPFEPARRVTLAVAMPRMHRQGYLVEKCTELGVAAIWPVLAERSVARPRGQAVERSTKRAIEAAKQSQRAYLPAITTARRIVDVVGCIPDFEAALVAHPAPSATLIGSFFEARPDIRSVLVCIGPEGGWTEEEARALLDGGAEAVSLGPTVLRSETAAVAALAIAVLSSPPSECIEDGAP